MTTPTPEDLERIVGRALAALPEPRAPRTLLPRVMTAVRLAARPWYERGWRTWPSAWQALAVVGLVVLVVGVALVLPSLDRQVDTVVTQVVSPVAAPVEVTVSRVETLGSAALVFWRGLQPLMLGMSVLVVIMCAACAVLATALGRVAFGGALRL